jgi:hypothetical protein
LWAGQALVTIASIAARIASGQAVTIRAKFASTGKAIVTPVLLNITITVAAPMPGISMMAVPVSSKLPWASMAAHAWLAGDERGMPGWRR